MTSRLRTATSAVATLGLLAGVLGAPAAPARAAGPFTASPTALAFGSQEIQGSTTLAVTLLNEDAASHAVGTASITGATDDFTIAADTCSGATVPPAASCGITVRFRPSTTGARAGSLDIPADGGATTTSIALSGTGLADLSGSWAVAFGDVALGAPAVTQVASIVNYGGSVTLTPTSTSLTGGQAADFAIVADGCSGATLGTAQGCEVTVAFQPSALGARGTHLVISGPPPLGDLVLALSGMGTSPASPLTWASTRAAGPNYTWNYGVSLGRTVDGGTQRLHLAYNTDRVGGKWVKDAGPYLGVYYVRSTTGSTWTSPKRLNPSTQHAGRTTLAAAGSRVYVVWVSQKKVSPSPTAARVLYVRVNTDHGAATKWKAPIRLSSTTGRVDYPIVAASGKHAYVTWTDSRTGSIKLASSHDSGATWSTKTVGSTSYQSASGEGYEGVPVVSASGSGVAVAWAYNAAGGVRVRTSADKGATWDVPTTLADESYSTVSVAIRGSRVAASWVDAQGVVVALRSSGTWGAPALVAAAVGYAYGPAVVLQDPNRVAVSYTDDDGVQGTLSWVESPDGGAAWYQPQAIATPTTTRASNDWPSVAWPSAGTRIVAWNGWNTTDTYRQYLRVGSGTPAGIPSEAQQLTPLSLATVPPGGARHRNR